MQRSVEVLNYFDLKISPALPVASEKSAPRGKPFLPETREAGHGVFLSLIAPLSRDS